MRNEKRKNTADAIGTKRPPRFIIEGAIPMTGRAAPYFEVSQLVNVGEDGRPAYVFICAIPRPLYFYIFEEGRRRALEELGKKPTCP